MDLSVILGMLGAIASISIGDVMEGGNPVHVLHLVHFNCYTNSYTFC